MPSIPGIPNPPNAELRRQEEEMQREREEMQRDRQNYQRRVNELREARQRTFDRQHAGEVPTAHIEASIVDVPMVHMPLDGDAYASYHYRAQIHDAFLGPELTPLRSLGMSLDNNPISPRNWLTEIRSLGVIIDSIVISRFGTPGTTLGPTDRILTLRFTSACTNCGLNVPQMFVRSPLITVRHRHFVRNTLRSILDEFYSKIRRGDLSLLCDSCRRLITPMPEPIYRAVRRSERRNEGYCSSELLKNLDALDEKHGRR